MSDTLKKIRKLWMEKRKGSTDVCLPTAPFLAMVVSECEMIGKNKGRDVTDEEVIRHLKKIQKGVCESIDVCEDSDRLWELGKENAFCGSLLPQSVPYEQLHEFVVGLDANNIGQIMGATKKEFGAKADMKMAQEIAKEILS